MFTLRRRKPDKHSAKSKKVVKTKIYLPRVVHTAQTKARQALDKSKKFVKIMICKYQVVYMAQSKA